MTTPIGRGGVIVIAGPTVEPVSLIEARLHLRLFTTGSPPAHPDDDWITDTGLPAAREYCEGWLGRALAPQTLEYAVGQFSASGIELPMGPVHSIVSVTYSDGDGVPQTLADSAYYFDGYADPAAIYVTYGTSWPTVHNVANAVKVRYLAGYQLAGSSPSGVEIPKACKHAIKLMLGHLYENREATGAQQGSAALSAIPLGVIDLLQPHRLRLAMA